MHRVIWVARCQSSTLGHDPDLRRAGAVSKLFLMKRLMILAALLSIVSWMISSCASHPTETETKTNTTSTTMPVPAVPVQSASRSATMPGIR